MERDPLMKTHYNPVSLVDTDYYPSESDQKLDELTFKLVLKIAALFSFFIFMLAVVAVWILK